MLRRLCAVVLLAVSVPVALARAAQADAPAAGVDLPGLTNYATALLIDPTHHQMVVAGNGGIDVAASDASSATHISSPSSVGGLALSTDKATLWFSDQVAGALVATDAADLAGAVQHDHPLPTDGAPLCPHTLAVDSQDRVWFDYRYCATDSAAGVGRYDPSTDTFAMHPLDSQLAALGGVDLVVNNPATPDLLAVRGEHIATIDVSGDPVVHEDSDPTILPTGPGELAVSSDGTRLADADSVLSTLSASDPDAQSDRTSFDPSPLNYYGDGTAHVAFSADGAQLAAGYNGEIVSFGTGTGDTAWIRRCDNTSRPDALAWDGGSIWFVQTNTLPLRLSRCDGMTTPQSFIGVPLPRYVVSGQQFSAPITLRYRNQPIADATIMVQRDDVGLTPLTTNALGQAQLADSAQPGGHTYTLTYVGDSTHPAYTTTLLVTGGSAPTGFATGDWSTTHHIDLPITIHDRLLSGGVGLGSEHLTVTRVDALGRHHLAAVVTDAKGQFSFTDTPRYGPRAKYVVSFAGDGGYQPSNNSYQVAVTRKRPALTISLRYPAIWYDQSATVRIHLGRTFRSRTVTLSALPAGRYRSHRVLTGTVNSHGDLTSSVPISRNTKFIADFKGDPRYNAREVSVTELSAPRPYVRIVGGYATSGKYRLYHAGSLVKQIGKLMPAHAGQCLRFNAAHRADGKWVEDAASDCIATNRKGIAVAYFHAPHPRLGVAYIFQTFFDGDAVHDGSTSAGKFAKFTAASSAARATSPRIRSKGVWTIGR